MQKMKALVVAGALCWPVIGYAQTAPWGYNGKYPGARADSSPPTEPNRLQAPAAPPTTGVTKHVARKVQAPPATKPASAAGVAMVVPATEPENPYGTGPGVAVPYSEIMPFHEPCCPERPKCCSPCSHCPLCPWSKKDPCEPACAPDCCLSCGHVVVWLEGLWLQPRRNAAFAIETVDTTDVSHEYDGEYEIGFRVGGGYVTCDKLMFSGMFTHLDGPGGDASFANRGAFVFTGPGALNGLTGDQLISRWDVRYQTLDLMASAILSPAACVDLVVGAGVRMASIDQRYQTQIISEGGTSIEELNLEMAGAGPRAGADGRIYLLDWLALYGRGYASILLAEREESSAAVVQETPFFSSFDRPEVVPNMELAAGVEACLCDGQILIGGGYEFNYWFNLGDSHVRSVTGNVTPNRADVCLDGLYARVMLMW